MAQFFGSGTNSAAKSISVQPQQAPDPMIKKPQNQSLQNMASAADAPKSVTGPVDSASTPLYNDGQVTEEDIQRELNTGDPERLKQVAPDYAREVAKQNAKNANTKSNNVLTEKENTRRAAYWDATTKTFQKGDTGRKTTILTQDNPLTKNSGLPKTGSVL